MRMQNNGFEVQYRGFERGIIIDLQGDLTKQAEEILLHSRNWENGLDDGKNHLILNFSRVPYINSSGIATLIRIVRAGTKGNYHTFAYGLSSHYEKLFRMVGLTEYMMIYPDEYAVMQRIAG